MLIKIVILKEIYSLRIKNCSSKYMYIKLFYYALFENWLMKYWVKNKINNFGTILCLYTLELGKEAILEKFVCNDVSDRAQVFT